MAGAALAILGAGIGIGYGIFGRREERAELERIYLERAQPIYVLSLIHISEPIYVKTLDELTGDLYYPSSIEILRGRNPYGNNLGIIKVKASDGKGKAIEFSIYERDPMKFEQLVSYFQCKMPFGLVDPLHEQTSGYPRDYKNAINLRIERTAEGNPVYILDGDDIRFYSITPLY